jgi:hypothetical protein
MPLYVIETTEELLGSVLHHSKTTFRSQSLARTRIARSNFFDRAFSLSFASKLFTSIVYLFETFAHLFEAFEYPFTSEFRLKSLL